MQKNDLVVQITLYLSNGGLFNPELANHVAVRDLLIQCKEALAQPEITTGNILMDSYNAMQSMKVEGPRHVVCQCDKCKAQPEQEPVAWEQFHEHMAGPNYVAPQRTWVGLTAKEKHEFRYSHMTTADFIDAIEAKLKDKNTSGQE